MSELAPVVPIMPPALGAGTAQLTAAIANVMKDIDTVAKRGVNEFHRYKYATMSDILQEITPLLGKHGLAIFQSETGRAMFDNDNVIAIEYAFIVAHESGETWPHALRQTGVSTCRNSKGGWDDKSLNKCHTAARKYFLLSLFQIPTGEEEDADKGENDSRIIRKTLPKKDSRGVYVKLQGDIRNMNEIGELRAWGEANAERIAVLPEDWQDILRLQYAEKLVELRQFPPKRIEAQTAVVWDADCVRPATEADLAPVISHREMLNESMKPLDHSDHGGIPGFCVRKLQDDEPSYVDLVGAE
jgi:ERF superfamily protein